MQSKTETYAQYAGQIGAGHDVYDSDGEKIGSVAAGDADPAAQYFIVEKGFLFPTELYVPFSAISRIDGDDIWLSMTKNEIEGQRWDTMPDARTAEMGQAVAGYQERADDAVLERSEERLEVDKQPVKAGEVRVGKRVVEEQQSVDVPITREEVEINTQAVDRPAGADAFEEEEIRVPVSEERVTTSKEARVVEELDVDKVANQDTKRVSDTVRREEFEIDRSGDTEGN
jgi:uncharacterized protein (TIGR02271 family)